MLARTNRPRGNWHIAIILVLALNVGWLAGLAFADPPTKVGQQSAKPITPMTTRLCNSSLITIRDQAAAAPYPSEIEVSGLSGIVTHVTVDLYGLYHEFMGDIDILLAGPQGESAVLMSDAGDACSPRGVNISFDDGKSLLSRYSSGGCPVSNSGYAPTDYLDKPQDSFPAPAPLGSWRSTLS